MFWQTAYAQSTTIHLPKASTVASGVDSVADLVFWVSVFFFLLIGGAIAYFAIAYHRNKKGRTTAYILGNHTFEFVWTIVPLVFMLGIFYWGAHIYNKSRAIVAGALEVNVVGRQWLWNFEYPNGRKTLNELFIPKDRPVRLIMTSEDVLHSFYLPTFRLKQDTVPGMYTYISLQATIPGEHPIYCTEFCGTGHSDMLGKAYVLDEKEFDTWYESGKAQLSGLQKVGYNPGIGKINTWASAPSGGTSGKSLADKGKDLFGAKGCFACHATDGTRKVGPPLNGVFGHDVELEGGTTAKVDENYIRESLMDPQKSIVKGYPPSMPTYRGQVNDEEINALIAYIKSLK